MVAIADEEVLYALEFAGCMKKNYPPGRTEPMHAVEEQIDQYVHGKRPKFTVPLFLQGSLFQKEVFEALKKIPFGMTQSYLAIATAIGRPSACRAVARAVGANPFLIVIPCHRVIYASGALGGYRGGAARKKWLIDYEQSKICCS